MKKERILIVIVILVITGYNCSGAEKRYRVPFSESYSQNSSTDSVLVGIENKIYQAFVNSMIRGNPGPLVQVEESLQAVSGKDRNTLVDYWLAYSLYYRSIYHLTIQQAKESEKALNRGIQVLEHSGVKTSEHYALLALMQSFSIQFSPGMKAVFISNKVRENATLAIEKDQSNLRGYYVLGSNDFYTPQQYGGGKNCEHYLLKAISLKDQVVENPTLPSWGKNQAYELLIRHYLKNGQTDKAESYYTEAITAYPDDYMLNQLAREFAAK